MSEYASMEELLEKLEKIAQDFKYEHQIGNLFEPFIEKYIKEGDSFNESRAHNEREIFFFEVGEGKLNPRIIYNDPQGNPIPYPDISKFDDESLDYIISRFEKTKNPVLKARYSIALWESSKKHGKYARAAIDSYIELVDVYSKLDAERSQDFYGLRVLDSIKNAYILSKQIKDEEKITLIKGLIVNLILHYPWESNTSFALRKFLLEFMLEQKFEKEYFEPLNDAVQSLIDSLSGHQKIMILEIKSKINKKQSLDEKRDLRLIAEEYEKMMEGAIKNNPLAAMKFWEDALVIYKQISDDTKVDQLNHMYEDIKKEAKYEEFGYKVDMTKIDLELDRIVEKISDMDSEKIIKILIGDTGLLPKITVVKEQAKALALEHPLTRLFPVTLLDEQGNVVQKFTTEEEKEQYGILSNYRLHMEMINNLLITKLFKKIISENLIDENDLIKFLEEKTWLGVQLEKQSAKGIVEKYKWIDLIEPGLRDYFNETRKYIQSDKQHSFILPLDSLILKIEGMFRDMCRLSGIPTFFSKRISDEYIIHEKDLNLILRENLVSDFSEDEIMFFKFVLIEKIGYNLRNKVAHALMSVDDYNFTHMNLVVLIVLKFGEFTLR